MLRVQDADKSAYVQFCAPGVMTGSYALCYPPTGAATTVGQALRVATIDTSGSLLELDLEWYTPADVGDITKRDRRDWAIRWWRLWGSHAECRGNTNSDNLLSASINRWLYRQLRSEPLMSALVQLVVEQERFSSVTVGSGATWSNYQ